MAKENRRTLKQQRQKRKSLGPWGFSKNQWNSRVCDLITEGWHHDLGITYTLEEAWGISTTF